MKKLLLAAFLSCSLISLPSTAGLYTGFGLGASFNDGGKITKQSRSSYEDSLSYSLAVGYELPLALTDVRFEGEYLKIQPDLKKGGHASMNALMANGYINIPLTPIIDPYAGLGIGMTRFEHENAPAYQFMLGAEYELPFMPVTVGGEYRYFKITEDGGARGEISKMHSNIFMLKLKYEF
ncbi:MAG: porin family protein [Alphaproteobacteria bacterium]|nr:porin family protein [Alphaproteobacteria bacterium]